MDDLRKRLFSLLQEIPKGKVATYGQLAWMLGNRYYARAVGNILHTNPDGEKYPCYKVVNSKGMLTENYVFGGIEKQKERLEADGIEVVDYKVDIEKYRW